MICTQQNSTTLARTTGGRRFWKGLFLLVLVGSCVSLPAATGYADVSMNHSAELILKEAEPVDEAVAREMYNKYESKGAVTRVHNDDGITFVLFFDDVINNTGRGFNDPDYGALRRQTAREVMEYLDTFLKGPGSYTIRFNATPEEDEEATAVHTQTTVYLTVDPDQPISLDDVPIRYANKYFRTSAYRTIKRQAAPPYTTNLEIGLSNFRLFNAGLYPPAEDEIDLFSYLLQPILQGLGCFSVVNPFGGTVLLDRLIVDDQPFSVSAFFVTFLQAGFIPIDPGALWEGLCLAYGMNLDDEDERAICEQCALQYQVRTIKDYELWEIRQPGEPFLPGLPTLSRRWTAYYNTANGEVEIYEGGAFAHNYFSKFLKSGQEAFAADGRSLWEIEQLSKYDPGPGGSPPAWPSYDEVVVPENPYKVTLPEMGLMLVGDDQGVFFTGENAMKWYGGPVPMHAPEVFGAGGADTWSGSLSYWSPTISGKPVLLQGMANQGEYKREFAIFELGMLQDLGYDVRIPDLPRYDSDDGLLGTLRTRQTEVYANYDDAWWATRGVGRTLGYESIGEDAPRIILDRLDEEYRETLNERVFSDDLRREFMRAGFPLSLVEPVTVRVLEPDQRWAIFDDQYLVEVYFVEDEQSPPGFLRVILLAYLMNREDFDEHLQDLNRGVLSASLRQEFVSEGFPLSSAVDVIVEQQDRSWIIRDNVYRYWLQVRYEFDSQHPPGYLRFGFAGRFIVDGLDIKYVETLNTQIFSDELRQEFVQFGVLLSDSVTVIADQPDERWTIHDNEKRFELTVRPSMSVGLPPHLQVVQAPAITRDEYGRYWIMDPGVLGLLNSAWGTPGNPAPIANRAMTMDLMQQLNQAMYGGYSDWRLPSSHEMLTLINYARTNPAVDESLAELLKIDRVYWTNDRPIDFSVGSDGFGQITDATQDMYLLPIRSNPPRVDRDARFELARFDQQRGWLTVIDHLTGLEWVRDVGQLPFIRQKMHWEEALNQTHNLIFAGARDWRVPNINELASIYRPSSIYQTYPDALSEFLRPLPASQRTEFGYWSSTTFTADNPDLCPAGDCSAQAYTYFADPRNPAQIFVDRRNPVRGSKQVDLHFVRPVRSIREIQSPTFTPTTTLTPTVTATPTGIPISTPTVTPTVPPTSLPPPILVLSMQVDPLLNTQLNEQDRHLQRVAITWQASNFAADAVLSLYWCNSGFGGCDVSRLIEVTVGSGSTPVTEIPLHNASSGVCYWDYSTYPSGCYFLCGVIRGTQQQESGCVYATYPESSDPAFVRFGVVHLDGCSVPCCAHDVLPAWREPRFPILLGTGVHDYAAGTGALGNLQEQRNDPLAPGTLDIAVVTRSGKVRVYDGWGQAASDFWVNLGVTVTEPLTIADVDNDGMPDVVVATNRMVVDGNSPFFGAHNAIIAIDELFAASHTVALELIADGVSPAESLLRSGLRHRVYYTGKYGPAGENRDFAVAGSMVAVDTRGVRSPNTPARVDYVLATLRQQGSQEASHRLPDRLVAIRFSSRPDQLPEVLWETTAPDTARLTSPSVGNVISDYLPEIVVGSSDGEVYVFPAYETPAFELAHAMGARPTPVAPGCRISKALALQDVTGDGYAEIAFVANENTQAQRGRVFLMKGDGSPLRSGTPGSNPLAAVHLAKPEWDNLNPLTGAPAFGRLGRLGPLPDTESPWSLLFVEENQSWSFELPPVTKLWALDLSTGEISAATAGHFSSSGPVVGDVARSGVQEVVIGTADGQLVGVRRESDALTVSVPEMRNFREPVRMGDTLPGAITLTPMLADINGDGGIEVVYLNRAGYLDMYKHPVPDGHAYQPLSAYAFDWPAEKYDYTRTGWGRSGQRVIAPPLRGDFNGDGEVNYLDIMEFSKYWTVGAEPEWAGHSGLLQFIEIWKNPHRN